MSVVLLLQCIRVQCSHLSFRSLQSSLARIFRLNGWKFLQDFFSNLHLHAVCLSFAWWIDTFLLIQGMRRGCRILWSIESMINRCTASLCFCYKCLLKNLIDLCITNSYMYFSFNFFRPFSFLRQDLIVLYGCSQPSVCWFFVFSL